MRIASLLSVLIAPAVADAFCGTYVGGTGDSITNAASYVAFVHQGNTTTLTVANEVSGDLDDFALLIPVPQVLPQDAVRVIDPEVFSRLNAYSEPRLVRYDCDDFDPDLDTDTDWDWDTDVDTDTKNPDDVDVEARYIVGEYEVVILSAEQSSGLQTWLSANGYAIPSDKNDVLQEYIDAGQFFLAARVRPDRPLTNGTVLSPLQLEYTSEVTSLPIRIGTMDSPGEQDVVIYGIGDYDGGAWSIANYPEFEVPDECLFNAAVHGEFGAFYEAEFQAAWQAEGGLAWTTEYVWGGGGCDPCPPNPPDSTDLAALGMPADAATYGDVFFTRMHARYTPEQATQDLMLYRSGLGASGQLRYIEHTPEMESFFETCRTGWAEDPGTCDFEDEEVTPPNPNAGGSDPEPRGGCSTTGMAQGVGLVALLGIVLVGRRRRRV